MGTIRKRGDKQHQGIVRVVGHDAIYKTFETNKAAREWIRDTERELESKAIDNPDLLLTDLIDKYVKEIAPKRKMADSHLAHDIPSIRRSFDEVRMRDLTGRGLADWTLKQTTSPSTRGWHIARLFGVLRQAETHWDIKVPWGDMTRTRNWMFETGYLAIPNSRDRRVSDDEIDAIKAGIPKGTKIRAADVFDFCIASAMRIGEVCRITWQDLDRQARTIVIKDRKHPRRKFGNHQVVPLLNGAFEIIERQPVKGPKIFPHHPSRVSKIFKQAAENAEVPGVVLHDLRHEGISRLFELGFEIQEVALVSGHTNWRTLRRYTHLKPASLVDKERILRMMLAEKERVRQSTTSPEKVNSLDAPVG